MDGQAAAARVHENEVGVRGALDREQLAAQYGWVRAVARNLVRDPWGAEDVTQETLLAALSAPPPDVPDDQRLRAWLGRVAFNLSRLGVRQGARRRAREVRVARAEALPSVSDELESRASVHALSRAIAELAEPDRRVVLLRYFDALSTSEIAEHMGVSELAVRKRLWRARNKLRVALEPEQRKGRLLGLLLAPWNALRQRSEAAGHQAALLGASAGLAALAGVVWWWSRAERTPSTLVASAVPEAGTTRAALTALPAPADGAKADGKVAGERPSTRRVWVPPLPKPPAIDTPVVEDAPPAPLTGRVLDLDGAPRAGVQLFERAAAPTAEPLAKTDALGGFGLPVSAAPLELEARGENLATLLPARLAPEASGSPDDEALLLVADARPLAARVVAEDGTPLAAARFELVASERAFARVPQAVRLSSEVLEAFASDDLGRAWHARLARAAGLVLRLEVEGFEGLERETLALGESELFVLRPARLRELAGTVRHPDGRPAAGATLRLARASATADADGRFRLPLRGVQPDSPLEASDKSARPTRIPGFGKRVLLGKRAEVEVVLGQEFDAIDGKLLGPHAGGWRIAVFPEEGGKLDDKGREVAAAEVVSAVDGGFELNLRRGFYALVALAPDAVRVVRAESLNTAAGTWTLTLLAAPPLADVRGVARTSDGALLARAEVGVHVSLPGRLGTRVLPWGAVASNPRGEFSFPRDPGVDVELDVSHAAAASAAEIEGRTFVPASAAGDSEVALRAPRPAWLRVAHAAYGPATGRVLDADGNELAARGPLGRSGGFGVFEGSSAVLEVPMGARWLEFARPGLAPERLPIAPRAGELLEVRP
jgi:RNA polymerase sigma-70 factor (ECF subfamily)